MSGAFPLNGASPTSHRRIYCNPSSTGGSLMYARAHVTVRSRAETEGRTDVVDRRSPPCGQLPVLAGLYGTAHADGVAGSRDRGLGRARRAYPGPLWVGVRLSHPRPSPQRSGLPHDRDRAARHRRVGASREGELLALRSGRPDRRGARHIARPRRAGYWALARRGRGAAACVPASRPGEGRTLDRERAHRSHHHACPQAQPPFRALDQVLRRREARAWKIRNLLLASSGDSTWVTDDVVRGYTADASRNLDATLKGYLAMAKAREPDKLAPHLVEIL